MKFLLSLIFVTVVPKVVSNLEHILVCPVESGELDSMLSYTHDFLCASTTNRCQLRKQFSSEVSNVVLLLYNGNWTTIENVVHHLSMCNIRYVLLDVYNINVENFLLSTTCSATKSTIVISLIPIPMHINHQNYPEEICVPKVIMKKDKYIDKISASCPRTIWIIGSVSCDEYNQTSISATKILRYKNEADAIGDVTFGRYYIRNKHLIVGVTPWEPYVMKTENENGSLYYGVLLEMFEKIARNLQFTYSIKETEDGMYGVLVNGTWNGLIQQLITNETDIAVADLTMTYERSTAVDFTAPYYFESMGILIWQPDISNNIWKMLSLFSIYVWVALAISASISVVVLFALHRFSALPVDSKLNGFGRCMWFGISCLTNQGSEDDPQTWSVQTFMSLWWVYVFALLAVYSGGLIALLTTSHMVLPFTDLKGLAEAVKSEKYKLCVESGTVTYGAVMAGAGDFGILKDFVLKHPDYVGTGNCPDILKNNPDMAYIEDRSYLVDIQKQYCKNITYILLDDRELPGFFAFALPKNSLYNSIISQELTEAVDGDLVTGGKSYYAAGTLFCKIVQPNDVIHASSEALTLKEFTGPFVLFAIGIGISLFGILFEFRKIVCKTKKPKVQVIDSRINYDTVGSKSELWFDRNFGAVPYVIR